MIQQSSDANQFTPKLQISSSFNEFNIELDSSSDNISIDDSIITVNMNFNQDFVDGLYNVSLYVEDSENRSDDRTSIPISRYYYIDTSAPEVYDLEPWAGSNTVGDGHDITIYDDIQMTLIDCSLYFDVNSVNHMLYG